MEHMSACQGGVRICIGMLAVIFKIAAVLLLLAVQPLVAQETFGQFTRGNGEVTLTVFDGRPLERGARGCFGKRPFVLGLLVSSTAQAQTSGDQPPLHLVLECSRQSGSNFRFTLANVRDASATAGIGRILGDDTKFLPEHLEMRIRRADRPITTATYFDPTLPGIAGAIAPWFVKLPSGASYSVGFLRPSSKRLRQNAREPFTERASTHISTRRLLTGDAAAQHLRLPNVWVGELTSEWIRPPSDCHPGK